MIQNQKNDDIELAKCNNKESGNITIQNQENNDIKLRNITRQSQEMQ